MSEIDDLRKENERLKAQFEFISDKSTTRGEKIAMLEYALADAMEVLMTSPLLCDVDIERIKAKAEGKIRMAARNNGPDKCPKCGTNLIKGDVYDVLKKNNPHTPDSKILEWAKQYGWSEDNKVSFKREIAITSRELDRVTEYECPDCKFTWPRSLAD